LLGAVQAAALYFTAVERHREAAMLHGLWEIRHQRHSHFPAERAQSAAEHARLSAALEPSQFERYVQIGRTLAIADVIELLRDAEE
jgi:hypothetical protein